MGCTPLAQASEVGEHPVRRTDPKLPAESPWAKGHELRPLHAEAEPAVVLHRTPQGRAAMPAAYTKLGLTAPARGGQQTLFDA